MAVQRDLEPAAECDAVDERERRHGRFAQPAEHRVPEPAEFERLVTVRDARNTLEVRAGGEDEGLPVIAIATGWAANASSSAASRAFRPPGPNDDGLVWSKPLSRVISATGPSMPGTATILVYALVTTSSANAVAMSVIYLAPSKFGFSQITVPPMPRPMHMVVRP